MRFAFVSNVDGTDFSEAVRGLDPAETLFIVCSKTVTTLETLANAHAARAWCLDGVGGDAGALAKHFVAVSTPADGVRDFGTTSDEHTSELQSLMPLSYAGCCLTDSRRPHLSPSLH